MNTTLRRYLESTDDAERERLLEELILEDAIPRVRKTVSYRLRYCLGGSGSVLLHPDAEDLCHDVIARLMRHLEFVRIRRDPVGIRDFGQYAGRVAVNACNDYLRQRYPARARLKDKLRDLLERHPDFALWRSDSGYEELWCGFVASREMPLSTSSGDRLRRLLDGSEESPTVTQNELRHLPLVDLVAELFRCGGGPLEFEALLGAVASLLGIRGESFLVFDEEHLSGRSRDPGDVVRAESSMEKQALLGRLWAALREMPQAQRAVYFFGFRDEGGDDLLSLMLEARTATPGEIAEQLGFTTVELMTVWREMPLDNAAMAALLGLSRPHINKLRFRAHQILRRHFREVSIAD
jgi:RNA polymerase sigma factor (sigma-70 family)